jgi:prophage regulatory protein
MAQKKQLSHLFSEALSRAISEIQRDLQKAQKMTNSRARILSYDDLRKLKGISYTRQWILKLGKEGKFPRPVQLGAARVGFIEAEIDRWIAGLIEQRDHDAA